MKSTRYVQILSVIIATTLCASIACAEPRQGKGSSNHRRGQPGSHMNSKSGENSNVQWSADPERGWVRVDEDGENRTQSHGMNNSNQNQGKQEGQDKTGLKELRINPEKDKVKQKGKEQK